MAHEKAGSGSLFGTVAISCVAVLVITYFLFPAAYLVVLYYAMDRGVLPYRAIEVFCKPFQWVAVRSPVYGGQVRAEFVFCLDHGFIEGTMQ